MIGMGSCGIGVIIAATDFMRDGGLSNTHKRTVDKWSTCGYSIGESHLIGGLKALAIEQERFYPSIGTNGTIGTNGRSLISIGTPLVNRNSLGGLRVFPMVRGRFYPSIGTNGMIGTNGRSLISIGTPLVNRNS